MGEVPRPRMANERISSPSISPTATRHAFVIGCSAPVAIPASTFPPQGLSPQPSKRTHRRMSEIDRHSDLTRSPLPKEDRILMRALGCGVEALVAQLGAKNAIKRVETELRRAKLARSRKLHTLWSDVLVRIEADTGVRRNPRPPRSTRRIASSGNGAGPEG
jgi:hypothetical protein